jgi:uncharacterized protein
MSLPGRSFAAGETITQRGTPILAVESLPMTPDEKTLISQLFERLRGAATAPRDADAEAFIRQQIAQQPYAPYAMAQTIVAQNHALEVLQQRLQALESGQGGQQASFSQTDSRYGDDRPAAASAGRSPWNTDRQPAGGSYAQQPQPMGSPYGQQPMGAPGGQPGYGQQPGIGQQPSPWGQQRPAMGGGGGFLQGAMSTALGVAGGAMLFQGLSGLFGGNEAHAAGANNEASSLANPDSVDQFANNADNNDVGDDPGADDGGSWSDMFGGDDGGGGDDSGW